MRYNLTSVQKALAKWISDMAKSCSLEETFTVDFASPRPEAINRHKERIRMPDGVDRGTFSALVEEEMLILKLDPERKLEVGGRQLVRHPERYHYTVRGKLYAAVDCDFHDTETLNLPLSTLAHPHPPEIAASIDRLRMQFPDPKKLGFLVMRFGSSSPFTKLVGIIKSTAAAYGLDVVRADDNEYHDDLWNNVRTHLHGCGFGIAIYERIDTNEPNANVGLEVGYLMAMNKPVLFLKDKTLSTLQADLAGKLYKTFDAHDPEGTVPPQLTKWLSDNGIVISKKRSDRSDISQAAPVTDETSAEA